MSNQKGFIKTIIITVVAFIIIATGYFVLTQKNIEELATIQESDIADKTAQLADEDLATKDWKTYRNEEYGFEVKYPLNVSAKNWAKETPNMSLLVNFGNNLNISDNVVSISIEKGTSITDIETEIRREDLFNNLRIEPQSIKDEKIGKDNYPAKKIDYKNESSSLDFIKYLIDHSGLLYQIIYHRKANNIITESNFNLMLSTFKFIETSKLYSLSSQNIENKTSKSDQSYEGDLFLDSWKIYRNEKYGFEFKYPSDMCIQEETSVPTFENQETDNILRLQGCISSQVSLRRIIGPTIVISPTAIPNALNQNASLEDYVNKLETDLYINSKTMTYSKEKISLNNDLLAYKIERATQKGLLSKQITWFFTKTDTNLLFQVEAHNRSSNDSLTIASQILSTFKFNKQ